MIASRRSSGGLTRGELIAIIALGIVLLGLAILLLPVAQRFRSGDKPNVMNNTRQFYIAGFSMAVDFNSTDDPLLGWPGDLGDRKVDPVHTVSAYIERLVAYEYLEKKDMASVLRAPGVPEWDPRKPFRAEYCPFKIYRLREGDGAAHLFCATKNFTYNKGLNAQVAPYGDRGCVLFRKGGDGHISVGSAAVLDLREIGLLPRAHRLRVEQY